MQDMRTGRTRSRALARLPLAAAIAMAFASAAHAQDTPAAKPPAQSAPSLDTVTVTAQKREENPQKVPISLQVLDTQTLDRLQVKEFRDYARLLPSVSFQPTGPGFGQVYMRGVVSGGDGNHSGPLPSVGMYLDEQPITTIQGALDLHMYDISRVEVLSGPQGTLYGASSQAGTIRVITNKPDPSAFSAGYGLEANSVAHGGLGYVAEGFANIPMGKAAAIRLVGWKKKDAGYIDNIHSIRTYPSSKLSSDNRALVRDNYNDVDTVGARAALQINLGENWTITPTVMGQKQKANGNFSVDPVLGDMKIAHYKPEFSDDRWWQAALTVQGKIGNFDLTYAYAHLKRDVDTASDYNDYSFWYDSLVGYGAYWTDNAGTPINPSQYINATDAYSKTSHELRIASPKEGRFRFVAGLFWMTQKHGILQNYKIDGFGSDFSPGGWNDTIWLTKQQRQDHDEAVFGELSFDVTDKLTLTGGMRHFRAKNTLAGFYGYGLGYSGVSTDPDAWAKKTGEARCAFLYGMDRTKWTPFEGAPCDNVRNNDGSAKVVNESGTLYRFNATYNFDDNRMAYFTFSQGYRPGGINRRGSLPPYLADYLDNFELGWKTTWMDNRLRFNGSVFEERWRDFQFSLLGLNGLTEIKNANQARIRGLELDLSWAATYNFTLSGGVAFYSPKLTANYCGLTDAATGKVITQCANPQAPIGTTLPVTPRFKGNLVGRYEFDLWGGNAHVQGIVAHEGRRESDLRIAEREILGAMPGYTTFDLSFGLERGNWSLDVYVNNLFDTRASMGRYVQCVETICGNRLDLWSGNPNAVPTYPGAIPANYPRGQVYSVPNPPRTLGIKFSQTF